MLTKYSLEIDGTKHELPNSCIRNWDEICCAYQRTDFSGVVRTFTSKFEFVNEAYDMLFRLYRRDGVYANAILTLYTITDRWEWKERFSTKLDFSTIVVDDYVLSCNTLDTGLSTMIKANKNTKFEFLVGADIPTAEPLYYDRVSMQNYLEYGIQAEAIEGSPTMRYNIMADSEYHLPFYHTREEIATNGAKVEYFDQQESKELEFGPKFFTVGKNCKLKVTAGVAFDLDFKENFWNGPIQDISIIIRQLNHAMQSKCSIEVASMREYKSYYHGTKQSLPNAGDEYTIGHYISYNGTVWVLETVGGQKQWVDTEESIDDYRISHLPTKSYSLDMEPGDSLSITMRCTLKENVGSGLEYYTHNVLIFAQKFLFEWADRAEPVLINTIQPNILCKRLLEKISQNSLTINIHFSDDSRLNNTYLLAAESIRDNEEAKIYSSFSEFCDFMRTVFGYTYYIGKLHKRWASFAAEVKIDHRGIDIDVFSFTDEFGWPADDDLQIVLYDSSSRGPVCGIVGNDGMIHTRWSGSDAYNNPATNTARTDVVFVSAHRAYYVDNGVIHESAIEKDSQDVYFVHQSEIFPEDGEVRKVHNVREVSYNTDSGYIYSEVNVGYKRQNYDNINGRGEFNFNNTYHTSYQVNEKKLTLSCPYRADCYGIEFACQKRNEKTSDTTSDKDVFIVLTSQIDGQLVPDRTASIDGTLSEFVFNAALSPLACIRANQHYINMQSKNLLLEYTSSEGNSYISIDGERLNKNILIEEPLITCGRLQFYTDDVDIMPTPMEIIEVESHGIKYQGYLESATFHYAVEEKVQYKLIIKSFEVCY